MKRVMCIWFPGWPLQRISLEKPGLKQQTVLIYQDIGRGQFEVTACSKRALQQGVRPGMPRAEAEALLQLTSSKTDTSGLSAGTPDGPRDSERQGCLSLTEDCVDHSESTNALSAAAHPGTDRASTRQSRSSQVADQHGVHLELYDPAADRARLRDLAVWCRRFSPVVGVEDATAPECLLINIEGVAHLFHNERAMARHVLNELTRVGIYARVAIADTVGMGWAAARFGGAAGRRVGEGRVRTPVIVPPGEAATALRKMPAHALRLPDKVLETLHELDLRCVGQLLNLPRATLPSRFGDVLHQRIDQALGEVAEPITPELPPRPRIERWQFEYVFSDRRVIEMSIEKLLDRTIASLEAERHGIQRLHILIQGELGEIADFTVGLIRPSVSPPHLMRLICTQLERERTPDDICEIQLELISTAPLDPRQETLFACRDEAKSRREREQFLERISSRLGEQAVVVARLVPDAQPEKAFRFEPITRAAAGGSRLTWESDARSREEEPSPKNPTFRSERPVSLNRRPRPVDVMTTGANGPPTNIRWHGRTHPIVRTWGPERIHTGWWRDSNIVRDYYRIETDQGLQLWVFRNLRSGEWFLHGLFD